MKSIVKGIVFTALMATVTTVSSASFFDGKTPLLCSVHQLFECDAPNACMAVTPDQVDGFSHLNIDFKNMTITRAGVDSEQSSKIEHMEAALDGKLILSGIEDGESEIRDGAGWTISIMDPEGTMVMAVASDGFAIVGLGACVPLP
jgi:hypothetical protein